MVEKRQDWREWSRHVDAGRLIFIDETWAKTNMTRLRGRALRGERLIDKVPHGHWKTTTLIAALGIEGICCSMLLDGAVDGDAFVAFVKEVLVPELRAGDVVVMDNLSSHKVARVRELIEAAGAQVQYLPPYSPDLSWCSAKSSNCSERSQVAQGRPCGTPCSRCSTPSRPRTPPTASNMRDTLYG